MTAHPRVRLDVWNLALGALVVRLALVALLEPEPVWDGRYFDALARHLARGDGYAIASEGAGDMLRPTAHYPVGFPAFLGAGYRLLGDTVGVAFVLQALLGAGLVVVVHAIVRRAADDRAAFRAALVAAFHPGLVLQAPLVMAEPLAALLYAALVLCMMHMHAGFAIAALAGAFGGFATLVRPQTVIVLPLLLAAVVVTEARRAEARVWVARVVVIAAAFVAVVAPWSMRNARVLDGPALVSTNGGWNLAIGALPGATGRYRALPQNHGCEAVVGEVAVDRCLGARAREAIARDPIGFLGLVPAKLSFAVDYEAFPVEALHEAQPERVPEALRRTGWRVLMVAHQALLLATAYEALRRRSRATKIAAGLLALAPMIALARPSSGGLAVALAIALVTEEALALRLVGVLFGAFLATHAVFFGEDRYHVVVEALLGAALFVLHAQRSGHRTPK
jgi:hypothetical protein